MELIAKTKLNACIFNDTTNIYIFPYSLQYTVSEFKNAIIKVIQCVFYN